MSGVTRTRPTRTNPAAAGLGLVLLAPILIPALVGMKIHEKNEERKKEEKKRIQRVFEENKILQQKIDEKVALEKKLLFEQKQKDEKNERVNFLNNIEEDFHQTKDTSIQVHSETNYLEAITQTLNNLKEFDTELYEFKQNQLNKFKNITSQKAKLFLDDLKLEYAKAKSNYLWTAVYKESIKELYQQLNIANINDPSLKNDIEYMLISRSIDEKNYDDIFDRIHNELEIQKEKIALATQIIASLEELNYVVISDKEQLTTKLLNKEKVMLPVNNQAYQVAIALNKDNSILTRFVKTVSSQKDIENVSTSDKLQDNDNLKKWCSLQAVFQESLKKVGIDTVHEIIEDDESDVLYIVDSSSTKLHSHQITKETREL
jgi:hypothetical protein